MTREERERIIAVLRQERLLQTTGEGRWVLARSLTEVTLMSLHSFLSGTMLLEDLNGIDGFESITDRLRACVVYGHEQLDVSLDEVLAS